MNAGQTLEVSCDYCGLPVPGIRLAGKSQRSTESPVYCCGGCRFAATILASESEEGHAHRLLLRLGLATFCTMNVVAFSMALWSRDVYGVDVSETSALGAAISGVFRYTTLMFSVPVMILLGGPIMANAYQAARRMTITADMLVLLGVVSAFGYSTVSVVRGEGGVYFEVGCVVLAFLTLGKWFEASGKLKMSQSLDGLEKLLPQVVHLVTGETFRDEACENVRVGDVLRVLAGERFAVDGRIVSGAADIDEQIVTGESRTVHKTAGDCVYGGTMNLDGDLRVVVTATTGEETVSRMLELVRKARRAPGQYQRLADRLAKWFVPLVIVLSLGTTWQVTRGQSLERGILAGLAVALISCPCGFALATPMAMWSAMGRAAGSQVLFRQGTALEHLAKADVLFFDKTGTLTSGDPKVGAFVVADGVDRDAVCERAAAVAAASNHPLSMAIRKYLGSHEQASPVLEVTTIPGKGLLTRDGSDTIYLGSRRLMHDFGLQISDELERVVSEYYGNYSYTFVGWSNRVQAVFVLQEQLRSEAVGALAACRRLGVQTFVLTGDNASRVATLEHELGGVVYSEQLPADKVSVVEGMRRRGNLVGMIGDGLNDAPALAAADVGVALGCGADLTRDSASVCLLSNDLNLLPWSIELARKTTRVVRQNLFWAFAYNTVGIGLAMSGRLNPMLAGVAMVASSIFVVANSLRLNHFPSPSQETASNTAGERLIGEASCESIASDCASYARDGLPSNLEAVP